MGRKATTSTPRRQTNTSKQSKYYTNIELKTALGEAGRRQAVGLQVPDIGAEITLGNTRQDSLCTTFPQSESLAAGWDHTYSKDPQLAPDEHQHLHTIKNMSTEIHKLQEQLQTKDRKCCHVQKHAQDLEQQVTDLTSKLESLAFHPARVLDTDQAVQFYTGFQDKQTYTEFFKHIETKASRMRYWTGSSGDYNKRKTERGRHKELPIDIECFAVLVRLKVGLFVNDLSDRLQISTSQFSKMFMTWVRFFRLELQDMVRFPERGEVKHLLPGECAAYKNLRCLIDCSEVMIERPSSLTAQIATWSQYKQHNTAKFLVACTPDGVLCYIAKLYGGAASDKFITTTCGFLEKLKEGDQILADKGFDIRLEVEQRGAVLNLPPFRTAGRIQFEREEVEETRRIAAARIPVERIIGRIKCYHILNGSIPLSLHSVLEDIIHSCAYLTQFQSPILEPSASYLPRFHFTSSYFVIHNLMEADISVVQHKL